MNSSAGTYNFLYYMLQVGLLVLIGALLPRLFRIRLPNVLLPYWQLLLIFCLVVPLVAPRRTPEIPATDTLIALKAMPANTIAIDPEPMSAAAIHWTAMLWRILPIGLFLGSVVRLGWFVIGLAELKRLRTSAKRPQLFSVEIERLIRCLGAGAEIRISSRIESAATFGIMHPVVLLPEEFEVMDSETQASILAHELIHVRRRDWLFFCGEQLILVVFWCHPAVWWLIRRIELTREQVVDRQVLELAIDRRQYLKSLLRTAGNRAALFSANLFFTRHQLRERVALLLEEIHMSKARMIASLSLVSMMFCIGVALAAYAFPLTGSEGLRSDREESAVQSSGAGLPATTRVEKTVPEAVGSPISKRAPVAAQERTAESATMVIAMAKMVRKEVQILVSGTVFDTSRGRIPGVEISIADPETQEVLGTAFTDEKGDFAFPLPAERKVVLNFRKEHFMPAVITDVPGGPAPLQVTMNLAMGSEYVTITAGSLPAESAALPAQPIRIGGNVRPPKLIHKVEPRFPVEARRQGIEGTIVLQVYVGLAGEVLDARVLKGQALLDDAAIEAVRQWRYSPYLLNGEPQLWISTVTLNFKLAK